jgi:excisionase family DNA binding protein
MGLAHARAWASHFKQWSAKTMQRASGKPTIDPIEPLAHSPEGAAKRLGISVRAVYTLIATGELRSYKEGKRRKIPDSECQRRVQRKLADAA